MQRKSSLDPSQSENEPTKLFTHRSLADVTWSLISSAGIQQILSRKGMIIICGLEGVLSILYALLMIAKLQCKFLQESSSSTVTCGSNLTSGADIIVIRKYLTLMDKNESNFSFTFSCILLIFNLILGALLVILLQRKNNNHATKKEESKRCNTSFLEALLCLILVIEGRLLYIPAFEQLARSFISSSQDPDSTMVIIKQIVSCLSLLAQIVITFYSMRLLSVGMPSYDFAPWATSSSSNLMYLKFICKIATPVILVVDKNDESIGVWLIGNLCLQAIYLICCLFINSFMDPLLSGISKFTQSTVVIILEIGSLSYILGNSASNDQLELVLVIVVFQSYAIYEWGSRRNQHLLEQVKQGLDFKHEVECEQAALYLIHLSESAVNQDISTIVNSKGFSELITLWEGHFQRCKKAGGIQQMHCPCRKVEEYIRMFRESQRSNGSQSSDFVKIRAKKVMKQYRLIAKEIEGSVNGLALMQQIQNGNGLDEDGDDIIVTISIEGVKRRLIDTILNLTLAEIRQKFPNSLKLYELTLYSRIAIMSQPYRCLNIMRSYQGERQLSFLDRVTKNVNDLYTLSKLSLIDFHIQYQSISEASLIPNDSTSYMKSVKEIDIGHFIGLDEIQMKFNDGIEVLKNASFELWTTFTDAKNIVDPMSALQRGYSLAKNIKYVEKSFLQLESSMIRIDPGVYYKYAKVQKFILNDDIQAGVMAQKMRNILEMRKIYERNKSDTAYEEDSPFLIVDANIDHAGKIILMNEHCRKLIGRTHSEVSSLRINALMPMLLGVYHDSFIWSFNKSGETRIVNNVTQQYLVNNMGYLVPVYMTARMHYSHQYDICFFGVFKPILTMSPFANGHQYPIKNLAIFTFNLDDGRIGEQSRGFHKLLRQVSGTDKSQQNSTNPIDKGPKMEENAISIDEILVDFDLNQYREKYIESLKNNNGRPTFEYEHVHTFDLSIMQENSFSNQNARAFQRPDFQMRVSIRSDSIKQGKLHIGYVTMIIEDTRIGNLGALKNQTASFMGGVQQPNKQISDDASQQIYGSYAINEAQESQDIQGESADSASASSDSNQFSKMQLNNAGKFKGTPKTLKIVIQLILTLFLVSVLIATINLVINVQNKDQSIKTVLAAAGTFSSMNFTSNTRLILRNLINMANGYEPTSSFIIQDRWAFYTDLLGTLSDRMKNIQNLIDTNPLGYIESAAYIKLKQDKNVELQQINGLYVKSTLMTTYSQAVNLYTSKIQQLLKSGSMDSFKGNLYLQTLNPNLSLSYQPTYEEQIIYFLVNNSNGQLRQQSWVHTDQIINDATQTSDYYSNVSLITTLVSIVSIFIVIIAVSPIISKTEERRYLALSFFLRIPFDKRLDFLEQCRDFNSEADQMAQQSEYNDSQPRQSQESFSSGILFDEASDQQFKDFQDMNLMSGFGIPLNQFDSAKVTLHDHHLGGGINQSKAIQLSGKEGMHTFGKNPSQFLSTEMKLNGIMKQISHGRSMQKSQQKIKYLKTITNSSRLQSEKDGPSQKIAEIAKQKNNDLEKSKGSSMYFNEIKPSKMKGKQSIDEIILEEKKGEDISKDGDEEESIQESDEIQFDHSSIDMIEIVARHQKNRSLISLLFAIIIFTCYFLGSYFMALQNFNVASQSVKDLNIILLKENCLETLLTFLREDQIRNDSVTLSEDSVTHGSDYMVDSCKEKEEMYMKLRKNIPNYLEGARKVINDIEGSQFCEKIFFEDHEADILNDCKTAINGLLSTGISNTMAYMYRLAQHIMRTFDSALDEGIRDEAFLKSEISEIETIEIIDVKLHLFSKPFETLKSAVSQSIQDYYSTTMSQMVALYSIFLAFLIGCLIFFFTNVIYRLREAMSNTNLLLKIIPAQQVLDRETQTNLVEFFTN